MSTKKIQIIGGFPQPDYTQNDSTQSDYIKNKPTALSQFDNDLDVINAETMMNIMYEMNFIQPIADVDNALFVTDDNKILIL